MTNHVPSLELCKQLKEAGYKQEGNFWWIKLVLSKDYILCYGYKDYFISIEGNSYIIAQIEEIVVAPLASELMERLPSHIYIHDDKTHDLRDRKEYILRILKLEKGYDVGYVGKPYALHCEQDDTLPSCLAKMYIYLRKEKLI